MEIFLNPTEGDCTSLIQKAVDDCFLAGGGRVVLGDGTYRVSSVRLRSNTTLYLSSGVVILATRNIEEYNIINSDTLEPLPEQYRTDVLWTSASTKNRDTSFLLKPGSRWTNAIFRIACAHNVSIIGEKGSLIDGQNSYDAIGEGHYRGAHGVSMYHSSDMLFEGFTIKETGNWAFASYFSQDMTFRGLTILGGHDGVHTSAADRVLIEDCYMDTGDDAIAGFDIHKMTVRNCRLDSSCSALRIGGTDILVENCVTKAPPKYGFRGMLTEEQREAGVTCEGLGERTLSFFTYYSDFTLNVRNRPENIIIRNCRIEGAQRVLHFNFSGNERWQLNRPLSEITFEDVEATGIQMSLCAYGGAEDPIRLRVRNSSISFASPVDEAVRAANFAAIEMSDVTFENVRGPLVRSWGGSGEIASCDVKGVSGTLIEEKTKFCTSCI